MNVSGLDIGILVNGGEAGPELRRIRVAFERTGDDIADFSKGLFPKLPAIFEAEEERQFDSRGGGPSGAWEPLKEPYAKWKEEHYPGKGILELSGDLRAGLTQSSSPFAVRSYSSDEFVFGTNGVAYASSHQLGYAAHNLPARPPFDMSPDFERDIYDATLESVREAVRNSGLAEFVEGP